jgi:hypothetical protein
MTAAGGGGGGFAVKEDPQIVQTVPWSLHTAEQSGHQLLLFIVVRATEFAMVVVVLVDDG